MTYWNRHVAVDLSAISKKFNEYVRNYERGLYRDKKALIADIDTIIDCLIILQNEIKGDNK